MVKTKYEDEVPPEWMSEEATRAAAFDALVAEQKNTSGKNGPQLIDETLDLLLKRYSGLRREDTYR